MKGKQRFLTGAGLREVFRYAQLLRDSAVSASCTAIYPGEAWLAWTCDPGVPPPWIPFDAAENRRGFVSLMTLAERFDKDLAFNLYNQAGVRILRGPRE